MRVFVAAAAALLTTAPIAAQTMQPAPTAAPAPTKAKAKGDPNRMVCRDLDTTGSRVNRKRDCRTAQAWAEQNALDRQALEVQQANRGTRGQ